jgi:predicted AAA+ superfamily ATPase
MRAHTSGKYAAVGLAAIGGRPLVIDEVQRGGEPLVRAIKQAVDLGPSPGQLVLAGSSNFLTVPTISESLAGRAGFVEVWPFTQGEVAGTADRFIDGLFAGTGELGAMSRCTTGKTVLAPKSTSSSKPPTPRRARSFRRLLPSAISWRSPPRGVDQADRAT